MEKLAAMLSAGLKEAARQAGLPLRINRAGSLINLFFTENTSYAHHAREDQEIIEKFHLAALNHGLFIAPRGLIALSTVLTDTIVNETIERALLAMKDIT